MEWDCINDFMYKTVGVIKHDLLCFASLSIYESGCLIRFSDRQILLRNILRNVERNDTCVVLDSTVQYCNKGFR